jgi:hypothetical protein
MRLLDFDVAIPLLRQHIDFLIDRHSHFSSSDGNPILPENPFSIEWTREAIRAVVAQGVNHITQVGLSHIPSFRHLINLSGLCVVGCAPRLGVGKSFNCAAG